MDSSLSTYQKLFLCKLLLSIRSDKSIFHFVANHVQNRKYVLAVT